MNFKKHLLPILYFFCLCMIVFTISLTACTPLNTQTNHQKNHGLVEVCVSSQIAPQKTPFLLQKLSQESPAIDTISYDCISLTSSQSSFTPFTYGYQHYEKVYESMSIQKEGFPEPFIKDNTTFLEFLRMQMAM
ncbi:MAG TPA: hypothetical protein PLE09_07075 [Caldisericia bacterium]|nr:hypothetical protein [Caldisericia bacterium]